MAAPTLYIKRGQRQYCVKQHTRALTIQREETQESAARPAQMFAATAYDGIAWNWPVINLLLDQYERVCAASWSALSEVSPDNQKESAE